ncbi:unnamed protein product [Scytosiphon promiscuus]
MSEDVMKVAKECAVYEDVSGVITAVYSARYGADGAASAPAVPLWVRQMASLARLAGRTSEAAYVAAANSSSSDSVSSSSDSVSSSDDSLSDCSSTGTTVHRGEETPSVLAGDNEDTSLSTPPPSAAAAAAAAAEASETGPGVTSTGDQGSGAKEEQGEGGRGSGPVDRDGLRGGGNCRADAFVREGGVELRSGGGGGFFVGMIGSPRRRLGAARAHEIAKRLRGGGGGGGGGGAKTISGKRW